MTVNKQFNWIILSVVILLFIPLIAMQFTNEVNWTISDFIVAGLLMLSTGFVCEFILRKVKQIKYRILLCAILLLVFLIIWIELAVGIF